MSDVVVRLSARAKGSGGLNDPRPRRTLTFRGEHDNILCQATLEFDGCGENRLLILAGGTIDGSAKNEVTGTERAHGSLGDVALKDIYRIDGMDEIPARFAEIDVSLLDNLQPIIDW
jgi:hypothetical protein